MGFFVERLNTVAERNVDRSELRLVARAAEGDRDARRALFERYRNVAYRVALRVTGRHQDAMDVVQDGYIRAFERLDQFAGGASFKTWLLRIVTNRGLDLLRARKVRLAIPIDRTADDGDGALGAALLEAREVERPAAGLEREELGERLRRAIDALPPDHRAVFALYATGEMTYAQIAEAVGIPLGTVMSRIYHARRKLHEMLPDLAQEATKEGMAPPRDGGKRSEP